MPASREEFPRKVRAAIISRANGHCEACSAALKAGEGEIDHILPCALGGKAEASNGRLLCRVCHVEKSATDIRMTRKADRQRDRASGAIKPKGAFPKREKEPKVYRPGLPPRALYVRGQLLPASRGDDHD